MEREMIFTRYDAVGFASQSQCNASKSGFAGGTPAVWKEALNSDTLTDSSQFKDTRGFSGVSLLLVLHTKGFPDSLQTSGGVEKI